MCTPKATTLRRLLWLLCVCTLVAAPVSFAAPAPSTNDDAAIVGNWLTQRHDGIIQITRGADGRYQGQIVGGSTPQRLDRKNPDPALRSRRLLGQVILRDMRYEGNGRWSGGTIYDPDSGHTYHCQMHLMGTDRLQVRGFLGVALFGRSQRWTRYRGRSMLLPAP